MSISYNKFNKFAIIQLMSAVFSILENLLGQNQEEPLLIGDVLLKPILAVGGTDISHWFDPKTGNLRTHIDPITFLRVPYTPYGRFLHVPPPYPTSDWRNDFVIPWWQDKSYLIGRLTKKARTIRVVNTLTRNDSTFEVSLCSTKKCRPT